MKALELVIDANIVMSTLISTQGKTFDIIFHERMRLYAPEFLLDEINKHKDEIIEKAKISEDEFNLFLSLILSRINVIPYSEFEKEIPAAEKITPDENDTEYFALGLHLNCGIWSNDKELKRQSKIKIFSVAEIVKDFL